MTLQSEDMGKLVAGPLTAEMVPLLTEQSMLLVGDKIRPFWHTQGPERVLLEDGGGFVFGAPVTDASYVGERTPDGWIEGEWAENPVPGMAVRCRGPFGIDCGEVASENAHWPAVIAFRLAHREAQPETDGGGESDGMSDLEWAVYTAAYSILRDYENHPLKDRGLINAGDQRIPKLIAAQVVDQMAALASKGV